MKKHILLLVAFMAVSIPVHAQSRGVKIGYIDMEYILQNVPDYTEAKNQLEQKAQKWKQEIEAKKNEITGLKETLKTERVLLTKELLEEREEEITFKETELLDYQEKRFGPKGDLTIQKAVLAQPVQDQVFNAAQDIAEAKKYDFIFDKTSDLTILFAAKRYDISDQVIRVITRTTKRSQLSKKQQKEEEAKEAKEDMVDEIPAIAERQKKLDDKKAAREKLIADKKEALAEKKRLADEKRKQLLEAKKNGTTSAPAKNEAVPNNPDTTNSPTSDKNGAPASENAPKKVVDSVAINNKLKLASDKAKILEERKKAIEDKKQKALADREAARKAREDKAKENKKP